MKTVSRRTRGAPTQGFARLQALLALAALCLAPATRAGATPPDWAPALGLAHDAADEPVPPAADDPLGVGRATFLDWIRYTPERWPDGPPRNFDDQWSGGDPLLPDANGELSVARLQDWQFRYRASFPCPHDGQLHVWETRLVTPDGLENRDRMEFDAACSFWL